MAVVVVVIVVVRHRAQGTTNKIQHIFKKRKKRKSKCTINLHEEDTLAPAAVQQPRN